VLKYNKPFKLSGANYTFTDKNPDRQSKTEIRGAKKDTGQMLTLCRPDGLLIKYPQFLGLLNVT
jgi:hypothetical protein